MEKRVGVRKPVRVSVRLETEHDFYAGVSEDVGWGGVFVATDAPPAAGTEVALEIALATGTVRARGQVRWVRAPSMATIEQPPGCGIAWQALDRRSLAALRRFLQARPTPEPAPIDRPTI